MRSLSLFSVLLVLLLTGCTKDELQTVQLTGNYINTPDLTAGFYIVTLPDDTKVQVPKKYFVSGEDKVLGAIDAARSILEVKNVTYKTFAFQFELTFDVTLYNAKGEFINWTGTAVSYPDNTGNSWQYVKGGSDKFKGVSGWSNTTLATNPVNGVHTLAVIQGEVVYVK
jgi:hypothetical protein